MLECLKAAQFNDPLNFRETGAWIYIYDGRYGYMLWPLGDRISIQIPANYAHETVGKFHVHAGKIGWGQVGEGMISSYEPSVADMIVHAPGIADYVMSPHNGTVYLIRDSRTWVRDIEFSNVLVETLEWLTINSTGVL
jgi:hypothetical protein